MKTYGGVAVQIHIFLTLALAESEWLASRTGRFTPEEKAHVNHRIGGWVGPRFGLDDVEKKKYFILLVLELRPLSRPASSHYKTNLLILFNEIIVVYFENKKGIYYFTV
jgi:hypothetical protein